MSEYSAMYLSSRGKYNSKHEQLALGSAAESIVRSTSMDLVNDPRFFTDSVIDKRLAALGALSVISGLMVDTALGEVNGMKKDFDYENFWKDPLDPIFQLIGFAIMTVVLFANLISTYVGVAQPYHVYRLVTSGPTGFEAATSYYLNKNIAWWRHYAIKCMLAALPLLLLSTGLRLVVKFDKDSWTGGDLPDNVPTGARITGMAVMVVYIIFALVLSYVHSKHSAIFSERYARMAPPPEMMASVQVMMSSLAREQRRETVDV